MNEPYTPTTEQIRDAYIEHRGRATYSPSAAHERLYREGGGAAGEFDRWLALLSQPTPTAEQRHIDVVPVPRMWLEALMPTLHKHTDAAMIETADRALDGTVARMVATEPPRIEDMAPGTTFRARTRDGALSQADRFWMVAEAGLVFSTGAHFLPIGRIDPSTVRDVTPTSTEARS